MLTSKTIVKDIEYSFNISKQMLPLQYIQSKSHNLVALPHHFGSFEYILYSRLDWYYLNKFYRKMRSILNIITDVPETTS